MYVNFFSDLWNKGILCQMGGHVLLELFMDNWTSGICLSLLVTGIFEILWDQREKEKATILS